jgi:phosphoglucomutase
VDSGAAQRQEQTVPTVSTVTEDARAEAAGRIAKAGKRKLMSPGAVFNANRWLTQPQYAAYAPRLVELVEAGDFETLERAFWEVIPFGTGGRRGPMGELGTATINPRTIAESAHGLATYAVKTNGRAGRAVVAHDTRNRSREFAEITATTLAAHGFEVHLFESHRSTPELSFAVRHLGCDVGVMLTASHNPPSDNGFKAYWSGGEQVLDPHDEAIIAEVLASGEIPTVDFDEAIADGRIQLAGSEVDEAYLDAVASQSLSDKRGVTAIYSPLHGVGESNCFEVVKRLGFEKVEIFEPHRDPDGDFSNVPNHYPNPEQTAVFDPLKERAAEIAADVLLASDPDADRVGVCVRNADGEYVPLTGNQVGALIGDHVLRQRVAAGTLTPEHYVVTTLVSTPLLAAIAEHYHVRAIDNLLVGFKYIARTMDAEGPENFVFGTEESLGYLAGQYARDKDAAIGVLYVLELAAELKAEGRTLLDRLEELYVRHGYFLEGQRNVFCEGAEGRAKIDRLMTTLRENPPLDLGITTVVRVRDYMTNEVRRIPSDIEIEELPEPHGNLLIFESRISPIRFEIAVRPSGTEPKIKFYFFGRAEVANADRLDAMREMTHERYDDLQAALDRWMDRQLAD